MARLIFILTLICVISALLLGLTYNLTKKNIYLQGQKAEKDALSNVFPSAANFSKEKDYFKAFNAEGGLIGYAFVGEGKGYSSILKIMIGVDKMDNIKGIKILSQQETPGLGARVDEIKTKVTIWDMLKGKRVPKTEPWFQEQFRYKGLNQIQAITGATITSKAVVSIVKKAVTRFKNEHNA